ncbi:hypothetical protein K443DRAFT_117623 [Laccaria amethystina LaAM-08-1]|uniref:Uncharacterized protein n=1 Tax=Laccaria amethystina LaAM-08-1 TaxID=1095629 RepID=A0A0C9WGM6_9AGAR|nr:hypothetical protein K443DRAFT_117623 [Laccaria amethystina LaAM-08-1]
MGFFSWSDEDLMQPNHDSDPISPTYVSQPSELTPQHSSCTIGWGSVHSAFSGTFFVSEIPLHPPCDAWIGWLSYSGYTLRRFGATPTFRSSQDIFVTPPCGCRYHTCGSDRYLGNVGAVEAEMYPRLNIDKEMGNEHGAS